MDPTTESLIAAARRAVSSSDEHMPELIKRDATFEDFMSVGEGIDAQLIDGELWRFEDPSLPHQIASDAILVQLHPMMRKLDGRGWVIVSGSNIKLGPRTALIPDLVGWRRSRMPQAPEAVYVELRPDWVCEVLSPSTSRFDKGRKRELYEKAGVEYLWFVDPSAKSIDVHALVGEQYRLTRYAERDDKLALPPFLDIELDVARLWAR